METVDSHFHRSPAVSSIAPSLCLALKQRGEGWGDGETRGPSPRMLLFPRYLRTRCRVFSFERVFISLSRTSLL